MISKLKWKNSEEPSVLSLLGISSNPMTINGNPSPQPPFLETIGGSKIHQMISLFRRKKTAQQDRKKLEGIFSKEQLKSLLSSKISKISRRPSYICTESLEKTSNSNQEVMNHFQQTSNIDRSKLVTIIHLQEKSVINNRQRTLKSFMPSLQIEEDWMKIRKSRNIYIKTAQGKNTRIDPNSYLRKIEKKVEQLSFENSKLNKSSQNDRQFSHQPTPPRKPMKTITESFVRRKETGKMRKISKEQQFRPWSSCKSEMLE